MKSGVLPFCLKQGCPSLLLDVKLRGAHAGTHGVLFAPVQSEHRAVEAACRRLVEKTGCLLLLPEETATPQQHEGDEADGADDDEEEQQQGDEVAWTWRPEDSFTGLLADFDGSITLDRVQQQSCGLLSRAALHPLHGDLPLLGGSWTKAAARKRGTSKRGRKQQRRKQQRQQRVVVKLVALQVNLREIYTYIIRGDQRSDRRRRRRRQDKTSEGKRREEKKTREETT